MSDADNLTGVWSGMFSLPFGLPQISFTATLLQSGPHLSGTIHEPCSVPGVRSSAQRDAVGRPLRSRGEFQKIVRSARKWLLDGRLRWSAQQRRTESRAPGRSRRI